MMKRKTVITNKSQTSASQYISKSNEMCQALLACQYTNIMITLLPILIHSKNTKMVQDNHIYHDNDEIRVLMVSKKGPFFCKSLEKFCSKRVQKSKSVLYVDQFAETKQNKSSYNHTWAIKNGKKREREKEDVRRTKRMREREITGKVLRSDLRIKAMNRIVGDMCVFMDSARELQVCNQHMFHDSRRTVNNNCF